MNSEAPLHPMIPPAAELGSGLVTGHLEVASGSGHTFLARVSDSDSVICPECRWSGQRHQLSSVRGSGCCPRCYIMRAHTILCVPLKT